MNSVDLVVGGHHSPGIHPLDDSLKGRHVYLAHSALIHLGGGVHTPHLLVVRKEMLDAGSNTLALNAFHIAGSKLTRQQWILAEILEVTAAQRTALNIDTRPQQHIDAICLTFASQFLAELA